MPIFKRSEMGIKNQRQNPVRNFSINAIENKIHVNNLLRFVCSISNKLISIHKI